MMKLSTMKKVFDTIDSEWRSPLLDNIADRWGYDPGTARLYRASANFVVVFSKDGRTYFLRFNDSCERDLKTIEAEIEIVSYLHNKSLRVAHPVKSLDDKYIEVIDTEIGTFYAVVFEGLQGKQYDIENITQAQFATWGSALGRLHHILKEIPDPYRMNRPSWKDHLNFVREMLPAQEIAAKKELERIVQWAEGLNVSNDNFGLIHYDFELDNLCWNHDAVGILDFDDCAGHWYVADIAYALRDLFAQKIDFDNEMFQQFMIGYTSETEVDNTLLLQLPWFMRLHNLVSFSKLLRAVDIQEAQSYPDWLINLRKKLSDHIDGYRASFLGKDG